MDSVTRMSNRQFIFIQAKQIIVLLCLLAFISLTGCANLATGRVSSGVDIKQFNKFYVAKFRPDNHGINLLIRDKLQTMGYEAKTGPENKVPEDTEVIVTYLDNWMWDITMYMLKLRVFMHEPETKKLLASGKSYHTSLTRKSPEEMVTEVLSNIFHKSGNVKSEDSMDGVLITIPAYQSDITEQKTYSGSHAKIRVMPLKDVRKDVIGDVIGERTSFNASMGEIRIDPVPGEMLGQLITSELNALGNKVGNSDEEFRVDGQVNKFKVVTPNTLTYWDINGEIDLVLSVVNQIGKVHNLNYVVTCTDRTYVWPREEIIKGVVTGCLGKIAESLQNDVSLSGFLAGK